MRIDRRRLRTPAYLLLAICATILILVGPAAVRKISYPLKYDAYIRESAREFGLSTHLVAAVVKVESGFQADAVSPKNARGLMQILPDTAQEGAIALGVTNYSTELLFDPQTNIRIGCWYLSQLLMEFKGELNYALAAYNGGLGNVRDWQKQGLVRPGGDVSAVPFRETREFVARVQTAIASYQDLYERELGPKDARSSK
jgi:soluble lytic murein transglycosylase